MRKLNNGGHAQVFRITGARQGLADDVRARQRRYIISMSVRTVSVILAATLWNVSRPVAVVALILGAVLPYVAVVIANAGRENAPSLPSTFVSAPMRPMIAPSQNEESSQPEDSGRGHDAADPLQDGVEADFTAGVRSEPHERA
ncbi:hypothetical protein MBT84_32755 [Streptomyces sp. MBT84]|uniref:DUF3099 domain-containing protein n=1 Tax=unclassified Streptomyces TaxID=2593676 RepID=UPI001C6E4551|nr:DUF3099 domain-containing protein [Streptomyces sp. MBT84]MBW8704380.1 hypothetical protein [Streptomyces sp. MBT84]